MLDVDSDANNDLSDDDRRDKDKISQQVLIKKPGLIQSPGGKSGFSDNDTSPGSLMISDGHSKQNGTVVQRKDQCNRGDRRCAFYVILLLIIAVLISVTILLLVYFLQDQYIKILLPIGNVKGKYVKAPQGVTVEEYLGIPFARAPVGELRYADPVKLIHLPTMEFEAFQYGPSCIQPIDETFGDFPGSTMWNTQNLQSEDCLNLNIWVPVAPGSVTRWPVMIWLYGGGFFSGSNSLWVYDGKALAAHGKVIVVSINYRVGTFGYLSTGDGRIKGNFGMKDQVMALEWVKEHIHRFGGDPDKITIFGESSGASSAGLHMMSDMSKHLFHRAIFQSGSPDSHWSYMTQEQAQERAQIYLNNVNCNQSNDTALMSCLRNLTTEEILLQEWVTAHFMGFPWVPTIDGEFLVDSPYNLLQTQTFNYKDVILGVNKDEGTYWNLYGIPGFSKDDTSLQNYTSFTKAVDIIAWDLQDNTKQELLNLYKQKEIIKTSDMAAIRDAFDKVTGDRSFTCPTKELAEIFSNQSINTYFYYLTYRASNEVWPPWMGVIHGAEIQWVFGMAANNSRGYTEEEWNFSKLMMDYWTNFAKYGNPNSGDLPNWPKFSQSTPSYIEIASLKNVSVKASLRDEFCSFWKVINRKINTGTVV